MPRREASAALLLLSGLAAASQDAAPQAQGRWQSQVLVERSASFIVLPLPVDTYAHSERADLGDLRLVDAEGRRVPFAFLPPPPRPVPEKAPLALYPLPGRRTANGDWASPLLVQIRRGEVRVQPAAAAGRDMAAAGPVPGWLVDLGNGGDASQPHGRPTALRFAWSGPATFTAACTVDTADDLRTWRSAGACQLMALQSGAGPLTQADVALPENPGRFVRLLWHAPETAPVLTHVQPVFAADAGRAAAPAVTLTFGSVAAPADAPARAVCFDLGGPLPVSELAVDPGPAPRVLPMRVTGREGPGQPWQAVAQGVSYRLELDGRPLVSPPLAAQVALRQLCVVPDERADAPAGMRLTVQVHLPQLVFAQQGTPPFSLRAGSPGVAAGALPADTVVPLLEAQRPRFGRARLAPWTEDPAVAAARAAEQRQAAWRLRALWAVLLAGVGVLGAMVWRLARERSRGRPGERSGE